MLTCCTHLAYIRAFLFFGVICIEQDPRIKLLIVVFSVNDLKNAVPCAASYMLFDPSDDVMKNNVAYYKFHKSQWGLEEEDFLPRSVRHINDYTLQTKTVHIPTSVYKMQT